MNHALPVLGSFLKNCSNIVFVPYAGVTVSWDDYEKKVQQVLSALSLEVRSVHHLQDPAKAIENADAILVGGGNTFRLLQLLQQNKLITAIRERVESGVRYVGWSAGSNVAGKTICTTNDMPIVQPESFNALGLVPFQINPHFTEARLPNHGGETRTDRLKEYLELNREGRVVCLPEGTWLIQEQDVKTTGGGDVWLMEFGKEMEKTGEVINRIWN